MAAQKRIVLFTFLVLFAFMEETKLTMAAEVNICERERSTISCRPEKIIQVLQASYGRHDRNTCPDLDQYMNDTNCHAENSHAIVEATCQNKHDCELFANNSVFGDPCFGTYKYLMVRYQCVDLSVTICEHERRNISCSPGNVIDILQASYGRQNRDSCPDLDQYMDDTNCHAGKSHAIVEATCENKHGCELFAHNSVFGDPCVGTYKYLKVRYQCVDPPLPAFVLCQFARGTLSCPVGKVIKLLQASYGRHDDTTCPHDNMSNTNCHSGNSHTIVEGKCHNEPSCELYADNSVFGDPCPGTHKYLRVLHGCKEFFVVCQGTRGTLSCPDGKWIKVLSASYGRHDSTTCPHDNMSDTNCHYGNTHTIVHGKCHFERSCELYADNSVFGNPCPETHKYLRVLHECIDFFVLCQGTRGTLSCPEGKQIKVIQASYGRNDDITCPHDNMSNTDCHSQDAYRIVYVKCHLWDYCELYADNSVFGDPCPGTHKYLQIQHECTDKPIWTKTLSDVNKRS